MDIKLLKSIPVLLIIYGLAIQSAWAGISTGTGFFISADGLFLTCQHVVEDARKIYLKDYKGQDYPAEVVATDRSNDLVLLRAKGKFAALPVIDSKDVKRGVSVITLGFPHIDIQGFDPKLTDGLISSLSGIAGDPRIFQITVPIQQGNSGGPLITKEGNVVGVISAKLNAINVLKQTGDLAQNVNYAIKSDYAMGLIRSVSGIENKLIKARKQPIQNMADLGTLIEKSIALVIVETDRPDPREIQQKAADAAKKEEQTRREIETRQLEQTRRANEEQRQKQEELSKLQLNLQILNQRENDIIRQGTALKQRYMAIMGPGVNPPGAFINPMTVMEAQDLVREME